MRIKPTNSGVRRKDRASFGLAGKRLSKSKAKWVRAQLLKKRLEENKKFYDLQKQKQGEEKARQKELSESQGPSRAETLGVADLYEFPAQRSKLAWDPRQKAAKEREFAKAKEREELIVKDSFELHNIANEASRRIMNLDRDIARKIAVSSFAENANSKEKLVELILKARRLLEA